VDQAALTGESLPVGKKSGDDAYSGSAAKKGESSALVYATGQNTFFGQTAHLVETASAPSHFQKAVLSIGNYLIYLTLALVLLLVLVGLERSLPVMELLQFGLILTVAAIPVAMPAVLSVTMAVGALSLSKMKAIVSRLESIEEMAGMDVLCSDKTGTLTKNKLTLGSPLAFGENSPEAVILAAALASQKDDPDPIDKAVLEKAEPKQELSSFQVLDFIPFDPVSKRTEALIQGPDQKEFRVSKGAPQVITKLCGDENLFKHIAEQVEDLASRGRRTLGVARQDKNTAWSFLGILPLFDPPRDDARETIDQAQSHGIRVKMITGDHGAIARETARQLGLGMNIKPAEEVFALKTQSPADTIAQVEEADGFAQVFPEHKYNIVKTLQSNGHLVAMTGDGVNDAPALKQADVGISVSGATDAARAAADLVLTAPGLKVIVQAVEEARRIFERMNSYAIYRITETIRIMIFVVLAMLIYNFYPITAIMIILLALLNDIPIMTIATDNTRLPTGPVRWEMNRVLTVASVLGGIGVVETFGLLIVAKNWLGLDLAQIQSFIFLKLAVAGHLTLFVARTPDSMWKSPYPAAPMIYSALVTKFLATLVVGMGWFVAPISWANIALIWVYCLVWMQIEDWAKGAVLHHLDGANQKSHAFIRRLGRVLVHRG
jgi:H+-transporting ATPase